MNLSVIPAKAGIQRNAALDDWLSLDSRLRGNDTAPQNEGLFLTARSFRASRRVEERPCRKTQSRKAAFVIPTGQGDRSTFSEFLKELSASRLR